MGTATEQVTTVEQMREVLRAGKRLRVTVGPGPDDPVGVVSLSDGMVWWESVAGWSAGVVEPACSIDSGYLATYLKDESIEVLPPSEREVWSGAVQLTQELAGALGFDWIPGQRTVRTGEPRPPFGREYGRLFAVTTGRRWTRVLEYLSNGQLTARWFVDEATGEAREADGARKPKRWPMASGAQEYARGIVGQA